MERIYSTKTGLEIAVIGISGKFPQSNSIDEFWQNLVQGKELISQFNKSETKSGAILDDIDLFDATFFGFNPREAANMDPQHRLFLECAWGALEHAGYDSIKEERPIGVFTGVGVSTYLLYNLFPNQNLMQSVGTLQSLIGADKDYLPTRLSYKLNLTGPSVSVQTACSSSLVAVHMACQSLLSGECDIALAGGVSIKTPQNAETLSPGGIISPDGHCRAFDAKANGTLGGNGVGVVVLKRLEDALVDRDYIYAVVKGSAINNDGALKVGYTAPSQDGQAKVIRAAQVMGEVEPETISYMEAHGTGTPLGDPIEVAAMTQAFRVNTEKKGYCAIGSVKTNVGHLDAAAGIAGFIKTVLALHHKSIPPSLNFETANPQIDFENSPFYVNNRLSEWQTEGISRRAGVSSFGFGGTNAHVILEEAPTVVASNPVETPQLLLLSAKTSSALEIKTANLVKYLKSNPQLNLADVAYTLQIGRREFAHRRIVVTSDLQDTVKVLESNEPQRVFSQYQQTSESPVIFMFAGQGAQYVNMARELYETEEIFKQECDRLFDLLKPHLEFDLCSCLFPEDAEVETATQKLQQTAVTQPALFAIEYALAKLWMSWGIHPRGMIGHSIGEYVAACVAGVFSLEDALALVAARGKLMQQAELGKMLSVGLSAEEVESFLGENLSVAAVNSPSLCVVSGTTEAIEELEKILQENQINCRSLHTNHAFHSPMMDSIVEPFLQLVKQVKLNPPKIPFISNVTGTWIAPGEATSPIYWARHLRQPVQFAPGIAELIKDSQAVFLEVAPGRTLSTLVKKQASSRVILSSLRHPKEEQKDVNFLLNSLGKLWLAGVSVNWSGFHGDKKPSRIPLPTYPFEHQRYWVEAPEQETDTGRQPLKTALELWQSLIESDKVKTSTKISEFDQQIYVENQQSLQGLCNAYINLALRNLGAFSSPEGKYSFEELCEQCQVIPRYRQLLHRWLQILVEQGHLQQEQGLFTNLVSCSKPNVDTFLEEVKARWADSPKVIDPKVLNLVQRCGEELNIVAIGKKQPVEFFAGALFNFNQAENENIESPWHNSYSKIIQAILRQAVSSSPPQANLRILEIAGGTDYLTEELLPLLPSSQTNYIFADVSGSFLNEAQQKFSKYPYIECRPLDINQLPTEQGYSKGSFDVVVAVKSLHIAKNIEETLQNVRSLLAPGGFLILWEKTQQTPDLDITWALLMNPLHSEERSLDNLYLSKEEWQQALHASGFIEVAAFPEIEALGQQVLVAQAPASAAPSVPLAFSFIEDKNTSQLPSGKKPDITDWFYIPSWKRFMPPQSFQSTVKVTEPGCSLVFVNECSFGREILKQLELQGENVVIVKVGEQFSNKSQSSIGQRVYTINPSQPNDYETLLKELISQDFIPTKILHLWNLTPHNHKNSELENIDQAQEQGFYSLLFLAQSLGKQNVTSDLQIAVISNNLHSVNGRETLCPEKATLLGAVKVIPQEYPNIRCRSIDIIQPEIESHQEEKLVDCIFTELTVDDREKVIAYRDFHRWIPSYEQVQLDKTFDGTPRLRQGGVYLVTGGLGAIGLDFASHIAKTVKAKLLLTGRSAFPVKDEWEEWLISHDPDDDVSAKIGKLKELEELGTEIIVARADVADLESMQQAIAQAQEKFGQINGVFHAAGILGDGMIGLKSRDDVETVFSPKVKGTLVLNKILKDVELDFWVLCSSRAAIIPVFGQVSYSSANNFLDVFAHYKTCKDGTFTVSVNLFDAWLGGGIAVELVKKLASSQNISQSQAPNAFSEFQADLLKDGYSPPEGIEVFNRIMGSTLPQVLVSTTDLIAGINNKNSGDRLNPMEAIQKSKVNLSTQPIYPRPELNNAFVPPSNEIEKILAEIWQEILGIKQIGIYDNFFELGGDSLLATQVISRIQKAFDIELSVNSMFENPNVAGISEQIENIRLTTQKPQIYATAAADKREEGVL